MLESLFPIHVVCVEGQINSLQDDIHSAEESCVSQAVPKRRREFIAGRVCARRALRRLGIENYLLLPNPDRSPRWPPGIVGCIAHSNEYCAVAVAKASTILALGLDLETGKPLEATLWPLILNDSELLWLNDQPESERGLLAKLIFSIKECAYKCQFPVFGEGWEFEDLLVTFDADERFLVRVCNSHRTDRMTGALLGGRYRIVDQRIVTTMVIIKDSDLPELKI
jgi:4'-phosphopantetheinyl transferase EntD